VETKLALLDQSGIGGVKNRIDEPVRGGSYDLTTGRIAKFMAYIVPITPKLQSSLLRSPSASGWWHVDLLQQALGQHCSQSDMQQDDFH